MRLLYRLREPLFHLGRQGRRLRDFERRDALSAFSRNIDPARKRVFDGIFDTLQTGLSKLGTDARSQSKAARDLIYLIKDIPMDGRQDYDVLGFIYEYLISNFAANAVRKQASSIRRTKSPCS